MFLLTKKKGTFCEVPLSYIAQFQFQLKTFGTSWTRSLIEYQNIVTLTSCIKVKQVVLIFSTMSVKRFILVCISYLSLCCLNIRSLQRKRRKNFNFFLFFLFVPLLMKYTVVIPRDLKQFQILFLPFRSIVLRITVKQTQQ